MPDFFISLGGRNLQFSAAHFITYENGDCESLHGHDFSVTAEIRGPVNAQGYVVDFCAVESLLKSKLGEWDHRVLLPKKHPAMNIAVGEGEIAVGYCDRRWIFPENDCRLLPVSNATSECLAEHLADDLLRKLKEKCPSATLAVKIAVSEGSGFTAGCEVRG